MRAIFRKGVIYEVKYSFSNVDGVVLNELRKLIGSGTYADRVIVHVSDLSYLGGEEYHFGEIHTTGKAAEMYIDSIIENVFGVEILELV
ncbi:MAG: hypothetical protein OXT67_12530 [Zetaproteobacteria bacterium]|nr:hypothetical protein [Zetaproteobacteria bacterium]